ncbi:hypothetical protein B0H65DRAFT_302763 [Neurospora tetraspora]|uniref:Uncharacterized protein n=1 Tax=Neurospora tetraspora TaxID=94610 RepID=A0AAE0J9L6_9PEZI|nr:hypothetical protein B0H65DRAFT_302763 [Neurospora tetraspora]
MTQVWFKVRVSSTGVQYLLSSLCLVFVFIVISTLCPFAHNEPPGHSGFGHFIGHFSSVKERPTGHHHGKCRYYAPLMKYYRQKGRIDAARVDTSKSSIFSAEVTIPITPGPRKGKSAMPLMMAVEVRGVRGSRTFSTEDYDMVEECKASFQGNSVSPNRISASGIRIASLRDRRTNRWNLRTSVDAGCSYSSVLGNWGASKLGSRRQQHSAGRICLGQLLDSIHDIKSLKTKCRPSSVMPARRRCSKLFPVTSLSPVSLAVLG